jgi:hypothetical protein
VDIHQEVDNQPAFRRVFGVIVLRAGFFSSAANLPFAVPFIGPFMVTDWVCSRWRWCGESFGELTEPVAKEVAA